MEDIRHDNKYVQVTANNKFEWNTYMVVLSRNKYMFDKSSIKEFEGSCYIAFSEIDRMVHVSDSYEVNVWDTISMKQFLYKFNMLDKAIGNPKFEHYDLEGSLIDLPSSSTQKLVETLIDVLSSDSDYLDTINSLFQRGYIDKNNYDKASEYYYNVGQLKELIRGVID